MDDTAAPARPAPLPTLPDAVLFDMDGLILDSERLSLDCFRDAVAALGLDGRAHDATFMALVGTNSVLQLEILSRELGTSVDVTRFESDWTRRYRAATAVPIPLRPGAAALLARLAERGVRCAVATSTGTARAETLLDAAGVRGRFAAVIGGEQVERSKPHPDIFVAAGAAIGADMARSIGLEDSPNGVRAALAAGLHVIQVPDLIEPDAALRALGHRICGSLDEVRRLLDERRASPADTT